jgi:hypothetical protein
MTRWARAVGVNRAQDYGISNCVEVDLTLSTSFHKYDDIFYRRFPQRP